MTILKLMRLLLGNAKHIVPDVKSRVTLSVMVDAQISLGASNACGATRMVSHVIMVPPRETT
jgi:hypothetical protein